MECYNSNFSRACTHYSDFVERAQLLTQKLLKQGCVAPRLKSSLRSSSWSGWLLQNIHISNDKCYFPALHFCILYLCFPLSPTILLPACAPLSLTVYNMSNKRVRWMSYKKRESLTFIEHLDSPLVFGGVRVTNLFRFLCCIVLLCFVCLRPVSCVVPSVASVSGLPSLDCPFGFL